MTNYELVPEMSVARLLPWSRRVRNVVCLVTAPVILFGPIIQAAWDLHRERAAGGLGYPEVGVTGAVASPAAADAAERAARYRARRNPLVDSLLPEGVGGTRLFEHLGGNAGMAFSRVATIGLAVTVDGDAWPEATELHERAHLAQAFLPADVARLMTRMPAAAPAEYAATNAGEHFAEMAGRAWEIVALFLRGRF